MRPITSHQISAAIFAFALSLPVAAWTQTTSATAAETTAPAAGDAAAGVPGANPRKSVEERIADLHATLKITPAQEAQWDAFAQVMLDNAQGMDAALTKNVGDPAKQTAEQIMQGYADIAELHARDVKKLSAAFHTIYELLTPDQKQAADEMFRASALRRAQKQAG
jgi:periplasmic protein CpxP/Spy